MQEHLEMLRKIEKNIDNSFLPPTYKRELLEFVDFITLLTHEVVKIKTALEHIQFELERRNDGGEEAGGHVEG